MSNLTSTLTVRLLDQVSGPARAVSASLLGIGAAVGAANARSVASNLAAMAKSADRVASSMRAAAAQMSGFRTAFAIAGAVGAKQVYDFERAANSLRAITGITREQRREMQQYAMELNEILPFNNTQIMQGMEELARAGFTREQILGSSRGMLELAAAGRLSIKEASDIATNAMTAFRLPMATMEESQQSAARMFDVMAYSANKANMTVQQMGDTFKYFGPVAAAFGMSVEEAAAATMTMANYGIRGSEAGVAMRSLMVRLARPTREGRAALGRLGMRIEDYVRPGREVTPDDILSSLLPSGIDASSQRAQIAAALKDPQLRTNQNEMIARLASVVQGVPGAENMDRAQMSDAIGQALMVGGNKIDAMRFLRDLRARGAQGERELLNFSDTRQGARNMTLLLRDLDALTQQIRENAPGTARRMADINMEGIVGQWETFTSKLENLAQRIGQSGVTETVGKWLDGLSSALDKMSKWDPDTLYWTTMGAGATAASASVLGLTAAISKLGAASLRAVGLTAGGAAAGVGTAAAAGAGAAGVAGAAARSGLAGRLLRGVGIAVPAWMLANEAWELSGGAGFMRRQFPAAGTIFDAPAELNNNILEFNRRLIESENALSARGGPYTPAESRLPTWALPVPDNAGAVGQQAGVSMFEGMRSGVAGQMPSLIQMIGAHLAGANFTIDVTPRINMGALQGVHGDVGVDVSR